MDLPATQSKEARRSEIKFRDVSAKRPYQSADRDGSPSRPNFWQLRPNAVEKIHAPVDFNGSIAARLPSNSA